MIFTDKRCACPDERSGTRGHSLIQYTIVDHVCIHEFYLASYSIDLIKQKCPALQGGHFNILNVLYCYLCSFKIKLHLILVFGIGTIIISKAVSVGKEPHQYEDAAN